MIRRPHMTIAGLALVLLIALGGCYETRIVRDSFADLRGLSDAQRGGRRRGPRQLKGVAEQPGYAILLAQFKDPDHQSRANELVRTLIYQAGVSDLWVESGKESSRVLRGIYATAASDRAMADLRHTHHIMINGAQPYANARLVALGEDGQVITENVMDLRQYSGMITLQIGYYDAEMGDNFRKAAEEAAATLRAQGEEAFFYHGPNMSMVTVGLFTQEDRIQRQMRTPDGRTIVGTDYSDRVRDLQRRFPYNLGNGRTLIDRNSESGAPLESFLVEVP